MKIQALGRHIDWQWLQNFFVIFTILTAVAIPADFLIVRSKLNSQPAKAASALNSVSPEAGEEFDSYFQNFKGSTLFGSMKEDAAMAAAAPIAEQIKDLRLKGVVIGVDSEAIIENVHDQKSLFVKKGQMIGALKVIEIKEGAVLLDSAGEQAALKLQ